MHLQENTLYDLDLVIKVTQNVVQYQPSETNFFLPLWDRMNEKPVASLINVSVKCTKKSVIHEL